MESWPLRLAGLNSPEGEDTRGRKPSACANAKRLGLRAASLGATSLSQTGGWGMEEERIATRESGAFDAGLRGRWSLLSSCLVIPRAVENETKDPHS